MNFKGAQDFPILLPLFPVNRVLFPGEEISLHLSDSKDCAMIQDCLSGNRPFGVGLAEGEGIGPVGTAAQISHLDLSSGNMDILAVGQQRFKILEFAADRPYPLVKIQYFDDLVPVWESDRKSKLLERTLEAYEKYLTIMEQKSSLADISPPFRQASFRIAAAIRGEDLFKQQLLQMLSEDGRLLALSCYFKKMDQEVFIRYPWLASLLREHAFSKN